MDNYCQLYSDNVSAEKKRQMRLDGIYLLNFSQKSDAPQIILNLIANATTGKPITGKEWL